MNTKEMATEYRLAQWTQMIQERVANGESIKDFCQRRGVSRQAYFYWQRKLRGIAAKQIKQEGDSISQALIPSGWSQVSTIKEEQSTGDSTLPVEIGRYRVMVSESTSPELLEKVCRMLVSLC